MEDQVVYQCVRGTDIKPRFRVVAQNVPKFAEQTFYGTVLARTDLNSFQSHLELMWDGFDDPEVVLVNWIDPSAYDPEKAIMGLAPLYRAKAEPKLGEIIDLPEYADCEWHTSAHIIINLRMLGGVPSYTVWALAHSKETEVDHVRFNASYKAMQFDPELLGDQRRRGWGDRALTTLGLEHRADGAVLVVVVVERIDGKLLRFAIPGMGGREDWGRSDDEVMRARAVVDEVLVCMGLAPAHYDENLRARLYGGLPNLMAVRQWVKAQIMQQCQGSLPRLKPDLPPQAWGVGSAGGRGRGRGRGRGGGRKRRGDSSDDDEEPEPEGDSDSEPEYTASGRPKRKRKAKSKVRGDYVFEGDDEYFEDDGDDDERPRGGMGRGRGGGRGGGMPGGMGGPGGPMAPGGFPMRPGMMQMPPGVMGGRGMMMPGGQLPMGVNPLGPRAPFPGGPGGMPRPMVGGMPILSGGLNLLGGAGFPGGGLPGGGAPGGVDPQLLQQQILLQNPAMMQALLQQRQAGGMPGMPPGSAPMPGPQ